jgi:hypothetical protein
MIIGLTGGMGVGKSTAYQIIKDHFRDVELIKFAGPLYDMQEMIYRRIAAVHKRPETFVKDRKLLQWLGTNWGRDTISETLWVDLWKAEAEQLQRYGIHVVCDDVRFDNEADAIHAMGGIVIKITADTATSRITTANGIANHASEAGLSANKIDFSIANNGTLAQYEKDLLAVINKPTATQAS